MMPNTNSLQEALAAAIAAEIAKNLHNRNDSRSDKQYHHDNELDRTHRDHSNNNSKKLSSNLYFDVEDEENCSGSNSNNDVDVEIDNKGEDTELRIARCRERNREHARRTRRRKKAQLEALQEKVKILQGENKSLKQNLEECSIASILVGLSSSLPPFSTTMSATQEQDDTSTDEVIIQTLIKEATELEGKNIVGVKSGGKRKRLVSDASDMSSGNNNNDTASSNNNNNSTQSSSFPLLKLEINGRTTYIGGDGRTHVNWKNGIYTDENGKRTQLSKQQLESLRRERNRIHAKMTRDRKKSFISNIERTIEELESSNQRMSAVLQGVIQPSNDGDSSSNSSRTQSQSQHSPTKLLLTSTPLESTLETKEKKVTPCHSPTTTSTETCAISILEFAPVLPITETRISMNMNNIAAAVAMNATPTTALSIGNQNSDLSEDFASSSAGSFHSLLKNYPPKKRILHGFSLQY